MKCNWVGKSDDGQTVTIHKLNNGMFVFPTYFSEDWVLANSDNIAIGAAVDVETTGLDHSKDKVIEIGLRRFKYNVLTGEVLSLDHFYSAFQDPGFELSNETKQLTGITDEMVLGQNIDWEKINLLLSECNIIVAHNASFDRPFIDRESDESKNKIWACSLKQLDWGIYGFPSSKLEVLSIYHGFFTDAHRALNDVDALIYLLSLKNKNVKQSYFHELLANSQKHSVVIRATYAPYEKKDTLKARKYIWDNAQRVWFKEVYIDQQDTEIKWLEELIYKGRFRGETTETKIIDRFKI